MIREIADKILGTLKGAFLGVIFNIFLIILIILCGILLLSGAGLLSEALPLSLAQFNLYMNLIANMNLIAIGIAVVGIGILCASLIKGAIIGFNNGLSGLIQTPPWGDFSLLILPEQTAAPQRPENNSIIENNNRIITTIETLRKSQDCLDYTAAMLTPEELEEFKEEVVNTTLKKVALSAPDTPRHKLSNNPTRLWSAAPAAIESNLHAAAVTFTPRFIQRRHSIT